MSTQVYTLVEGGWLVRGTTDVATATALVLAHEEFEDREAWQLADEGFDQEPVLVVAREGLFRFNPCHPSMCSDGHGWHLGYVGKPGRGVFPGVYFSDVLWEAVEYD